MILSPAVVILPDNRYLGLYIHIPFCVRKCLYCDFVSTASGSEQYRRYVAAAVNEMKFWSARFEGTAFSTVYVGGGTPSLIGSELLGEIIEGARGSFTINRDAEITVEVNPGTISRDFWAKIQEAGVNRVSIGVQSFSDPLLEAIGRVHDSETAVLAVKGAREAGLANVGVDLIYGLPGQSPEIWETSLKTAIALQPAHVSAYCLSYEEGTPFERLRENGEIVPVVPDEESKMYYRAVEILQASGYRRYEISNFARPGFECRHNMNYWNYGEYLGIGVGAHSFRGGRRWENGCDINRYLDTSYEGPSVMQEPLGGHDCLKEFMMLGLRKSDGILMKDIEDGWGEEALRITDVARRLESRGLVNLKNGRLSIADSGLFVSNSLIAEFF